MTVLKIGLQIATWIVEKLPTLDWNIPGITVVSSVSNIFSWVMYFIPGDFILTLLGFSGAFYAFKLTVRAYRYVREVM